MRIQDIAREAGVSTATVSRAFSNHPNIRKVLRERVLKVARKHGFHPRLSARKRNVVLVMPSKLQYPVQSYAEMVTTELSRELASRDFRIEILPQDNLDRLHTIQFCGVVLVGVYDQIAELWERRFDAPLVLVDRTFTGNPGGVFSVHSDESQGMALAIDYLVERGHRRIGCLIGSAGIGNGTLREHALLRALARRALPSSPSLIRFAGPDTMVEEIGMLLQSGIDALFCPGGNGGIIAAYALSLFGRRIPEEISLIASERALVSRYCIPAQTTISQDYGKLVRTTADIIEARIANQRPPRETIIPYKLIERNSVADRR